MELALVVYLISVVPNFKGLFLFMCFASIIGIVFLLISDSLTKRLVIAGICMSAFFGVLTAAMPNDKQMYAIAGAYAAQKIGENPDVQRLAKKSIDAIEVKLDEFINENNAKEQGKAK
jgi:hypothetical protein